MTTLRGELGIFTASPYRKYPYFISGYLPSTRAVIFVGGLWNGLGDVPYLPALSNALEKAKWKLVQLHWSSAYDGFATGSLDRDRDEISGLVTHLRGHGVTSIVIMGHSTGSQDVIHYLTTKGDVDGGIMQAPVSDREFFAADAAGETWMEKLPEAEELVRGGKGSQLLDQTFLDKIGYRLTAYRLWSLCSPSGDDDYFSSDLPQDADGVHVHPLSSSFGQLAVPALALYSEKDQFGKISDPVALMATWVSASQGKLCAQVVKGANHAVEDEEHQVELCDLIVSWLDKNFD